MKLIEGLFIRAISMPYEAVENDEEYERLIRERASKRAIAVWTIAVAEPSYHEVHSNDGKRCFRRNYPVITTHSGDMLVVVHGPSFEEIVALMRECR